jgi:RNA polymerase primary sigma factor
MNKRPVKRSDDILSTYLKEINRVPLLTREEEETLARKAASGSKAARNKLVQANLRFVVNVAKGFQGRGIPLMDLINEGNMGLIHAAEKFDVDKGYKFISYAVYWIRRSIQNALYEKGHMIRLPMNRVNELMQIEKARDMLQRETGEDVSSADIARELNMDPAMVAELVKVSREVTSLDTPVGSDGDTTEVGDFVQDDNAVDPQEYAMNSAMFDDIESALNTLETRDAEIIRLRYGIGKQPPLSLQEVGSRYNLTKERIRQIELKALKQLRTSETMHKLQGYVA